MRLGKIHIGAGFFLVLTLFALLDENGSLPAVLCACLLHEAGHILALRLTGGRVGAARLTCAGAEIFPEYGKISYAAELLCVLAGPAAGLAGAYFGSMAGLYVFSGASLYLTAFNLLPAAPLDGGRALGVMLTFLLGPDRGERALRLWSLAFSALLLAGAIYLVAVKRAAPFLLFPPASLLTLQFSKKYAKTA